MAKILGPRSGRIKTDLVKLLKDDSEEVLQGLVPHLGVTLDCLAESQIIGVDRVVRAFLSFHLLFNTFATFT